MKKFLLLLLTVITVMATAQTKVSKKKSIGLDKIVPEKVGLSSQRLNRIDEMINTSIKNNEIPGAVVLVARDGKIAYHKAFGYSDVENKKKMKKDDIFRIASQTKAITATAVMMLWEEGKFQLDDPISKYIPEFANAQILDTFNETDSSFTTKPARKQITIRQLLTHTSGLGYGCIDSDARFSKMYQKAGIVDLFTDDVVILSDNVKRLAAMPLHFEPGEKYYYAEGLDVMGYFIELMSGMPLDQFFKNRIFKPLGMNDSWFYLPRTKAHRLVPVQTLVDGNWTTLGETKYYDPAYPVKGARTYFAGGAGLTSTVYDYALFLQMYLNGGQMNGYRLLSRTTVNAILSGQIPHLRQNDDTDLGLAFGLVNERGAAKGGKGSYGTFEWGGYFNTTYFADPQEGIIGLIFKQTSEIPGENSSSIFKILVNQSIND